jgi:UDP-3-O-[3-hydroxymyristoyl] N-acetylglucosamine deacetylase
MVHLNGVDRSEPSRRGSQSPGRIARATLAAPVAYAGFGVHNGVASKVAIRPSDSGISWTLNGRPLGPVTFRSSGTNTTEAVGAAGSIWCVEHLLAALYLRGISDAAIEVEGGNEIPFLDGNVAGFYRMLRPRVLTPRAAQRSIAITTPLRVVSGDSWIEFQPSPVPSLTCSIEYPPPIGAQAASIDLRAGLSQVLRARSFIRDPIDRVDLTSVRRHRLFGIDRVVVEEAIIIWSTEAIVTPLHHVNEFVHHKMADLIGDMSTIGARLICAIRAHRPGHQLNIMAANAIRQYAVCASR